jgi:nucleoside-diphosphate-sugar epimerase
MRILILGGTGLLGTAISEVLLPKNHEIVAFSRGQKQNRLSKKVKSVYGHFADEEKLSELFAEQSFDAVVDLLTHDASSAQRAINLFQDKAGFYIFVSNASVYGPLSKIPADETELHQPISIAAQGKSEAEEIFASAVEKINFPATILRPSMVFGPGKPLPTIWGYDPCLINRIRETKPIILPGDGYGLLQPLFSKDLGGIVAGLSSNADKAKGHIYNVAGDACLTWRDWFTSIGNALNSEPHLVSLTTEQLIAGTPPDDSTLLEEHFQYHMSYDCSKLKKGFDSANDLTPLSRAIEETIDWNDTENNHLPPSHQPWVEALVDRALDFEKDLALSDFAFDDEVFNQDQSQ